MDIATRQREGEERVSPEVDGPGPDPAQDEPAEALAEDAQDPELAADGAADEGEAPAADDDGAGDDEEAAARGRRGPGQDRTDEELAQELCALLFASPDPLSMGRLVELLQRPEPRRVRDALVLVAEKLEASGLPIVLDELAGGWLFLTHADYGDVLQRLKKEPRPERISSAALETLAIVAYRQPVTKAEIEAIRGVQSGALLRTLVDRGLVRVSGRADQPGAPLQYATTREFLDRFGLASLQELPRDGELAGD